MDTKPLERFATWARRELIAVVDAQASAVLANGSVARAERAEAVRRLESEIERHGRLQVIDKVAYTWFNRIIALRFMDARGYTDAGIVSPVQGQGHGQPEILADAKRGSLDTNVITSKRTTDAILGLLDGTRHSTDAEGEAYALLLTEYCRHWHKSMPFMFEREGDYTELLVPANLLADGAILSRAREALTEAICEDVEVIGWLYQFYISERKDEVFAGFKNNKKAGAAEIPAATQLFTPHWIVRYLVENSLGRLWMLNHPESRLAGQMEYYIAPLKDEADFLKISEPEELTLIDPACGSGHMLTYAFDLLYAIYEEEGYAPADIPELILTHNLHGTEIDPRAGALAAFALTMKARAKQRTFFNRNVKPKICVIEPISFAPDELDFLRTQGGDHDAEDAFWNQFRYADTLGSLIQPDIWLTEHSAGVLSALDGGDDILHGRMYELARKVVAQAQALSRKYSVVTANPPYMGSKNMDARLASFAKQYFPDSKSDLFAMFIERATTMLLSRGYMAQVTMQSWMFLPSYKTLRANLQAHAAIISMLHMGNMVMRIAFGTSATIWQIDGVRGRDGAYNYVEVADLNDNGIPANFPPRNDRNIAAGTLLTFRVPQQAFVDIPGAPIAYWASGELLSTFESGRRIEDVAPVRQGFQTGNNDRFMRFWFEVSRQHVKFDAKSTEDFHGSGAKYAPYLKGGSFRKWFGNDEYVVAFDPAAYEALAQLGNKLPSRSLYFNDSITWSSLSSGDFGARYAGTGSTFSAKGACAFPNSEFVRDLVLAIFNSSIAAELLEFMGATLDFNVGSLREIPLPIEVSTQDRALLHSLVQELIDLHRDDWNSSELAPGFTVDPLVSASTNVALSVFSADIVTQLSERSHRVNELQIELDSLVSSLYGLPARGEMAVTLRRRAGENQKANSVRPELVRDFVSYAVGCIFGRYSIDKPGLILSDQGAVLKEFLAEIPSPTFRPDVDNVIPLVDDDWFEDDIVERFRQFLRAAFGSEHFEENLNFVEESLGVESIRDYFISKNGKSKFYDDHVQRYKKRPIYWMFSSPKGSFNALIYIHRYTPSTVSTVLNEYLRDYRAKLDVALADAENAAAGGSVKDQKEADRLRKVLVELSEYEHDVLYPLATRQLSIDLDDSVLVNYLRFGRALKDIGLEKDRRKVEGWTWPRYPLEVTK